MNNNNFSLMRYFCDLGIDVKLLLMSDDGVGELRHFHPSSDTWNLNKYEDKIIYFEAPNRLVSILGNNFPWNIYFWIKFFLFYFSRKKNKTIFHPLNKKKIKKIVEDYDILIGSGIIPGLFRQLQLKLDVFYPYSMGIEFVDEHEMQYYLKNTNFFRKRTLEFVKEIQILGIRDCKKVFCSDKDITYKAFKKIGITPKIFQFPMVYKESKIFELPKKIKSIIWKISKHDVSFISHTRHAWKNNRNFEENEWNTIHSKHNEWIIYGYYKFLKKNKNTNSILVLSDYGTDVKSTQELIKALKISKKIMWIPKLERKEIMEIISFCDVGIGEFHQTSKTLWGGCGLEIMACGIPLIHAFKFSKGEFKKIFKVPSPPLCSANSVDEIFKWMEKLYNSKMLRKKIAKDTNYWFDKYNGLGLAKKILSFSISNND
ncbi:MAG: hypothetical protein CMN44_01080 [SAR116 cluster bacterium]|nr:hypothetical protein [SAR116 cluster bacterium]